MKWCIGMEFSILAFVDTRLVLALMNKTEVALLGSLVPRLGSSKARPRTLLVMPSFPVAHMQVTNG